MQAKTWEKFLFIFPLLALVGTDDVPLNGCSCPLPPLHSNPSLPQTSAQQKSSLTTPNWRQRPYWLLLSVFLEKKVLKRVCQEPDFNTQITSSLQSARWCLADLTAPANQEAMFQPCPLKSVPALTFFSSLYTKICLKIMLYWWEVCRCCYCFQF